jgi:hypothetical protein
MRSMAQGDADGDDNKWAAPLRAHGVARRSSDGRREVAGVARRSGSTAMRPAAMNTPMADQKPAPKFGPTRAELQALAARRIREARVLFDAGEFDGAYYLAGYAIECALKAIVIKGTPVSPERCEPPVYARS